MKTLQEQIASLKERFNKKITSESSADELAEQQEINAELDAVEASHKEVLDENAKLKATIVRMALNTGNGDKPGDESGGSKPKTIEECVAEVANEQNKGGK